MFTFEKMTGENCWLACFPNGLTPAQSQIVRRYGGHGSASNKGYIFLLDDIADVNRLYQELRDA